MVEINDDARGMYSTNSQIKCKTLLLKWSLCDYSDAYKHVKGTITVTPEPQPVGNPNINDKEAVFKNCAPFADCKSEINNTQIGNASYTDLVLPIYNLIEYSDNYSTVSGSVW